MKMPTTSVAILTQTGAPTTSTRGIATDGTPARSQVATGTLAQADAFIPHLHALRLESSLSFSLVFGTLVLGLVLVRHAIARSRGGPLANLL